MRQMRKLAQELGVSILLLHHRGKQGGDGNEGAIGSISFVAQSDQRLSLNVRNQQRLTPGQWTLPDCAIYCRRGICV